jgi:hypothetical protein
MQFSLTAADIAANILGQGLAQQIADAIAISGAPPINKQTFITNHFQGTGVQFDTTEFNSLIIFAESANPAIMNGIEVQWISPGSPIQEQGYPPTTYNFTSETVLILPVMGPTVQITTLGGPTADILVMSGSTAVVPAPMSLMQDTRWGTSGFGTVDGTGTDGSALWSVGVMAPGTIGTEFPPCVNGPAVFSVHVTAATASFSAIVRDSITGVNIAGFQAQPVTAQQSFLFPFIAPMRPLLLIAQNVAGSTATTPTLAINYANV